MIQLLLEKIQKKLNRKIFTKIPSIDYLSSNKEAFDAFVYTPLAEALLEIERRKENKELASYTQKKAGNDLEKKFDKDRHLVLHRQLVTPNYEVLRFMSIADALEIEPIFFEYHQDKFVTENEWKYALTRLGFYFGIGKRGGEKTESLNVINFNDWNGKKISDIKTLWGQSLIDFHHEFFKKRYPDLDHTFLDGSQWYLKYGGEAKSYYKPFLSLFLKKSILLENFLTNTKEISFTKQVFLPAFIEILKETGSKPLIVALEPTKIESEKFWMLYPSSMKEDVNRKLEHIPEN